MGRGQAKEKDTNKIVKRCKRHGELTAEQVYFRRQDNAKRCRLCIWDKNNRPKLIKPRVVVEKPRLSINEILYFFAMTNKFRDASSLNHGEDIFYVDSEKFIVNYNHGYMRQVG